MESWTLEKVQFFRTESYGDWQILPSTVEPGVQEPFLKKQPLGLQLPYFRFG